MKLKIDYQTEFGSRTTTINIDELVNFTRKFKLTSVEADDLYIKELRLRSKYFKMYKGMAGRASKFMTYIKNSPTKHVSDQANTLVDEYFEITNSYVEDNKNLKGIKEMQ